jgi:hypothetical protein
LPIVKSKENVVDFDYYKPINKNQADFHRSKAKNKLLIGPYRSGKTYPAIHEALFICFDNPGHEFGVFRNTWESLRDNVQKDFIAVAEQANAIKPNGWIKAKDELHLKCDTVVRFRPLSLSRAQFKGMNMCGFLIDDPDVVRHKETIAFLFTRLTNPPGSKAQYFATVFCANYEGHDWLWQTFMRRREPGGDDMFAYWFCRTQDNKTLDPDYIKTQAAIHSEAWMKRYIYGDLDGFVGLVYDEYDPKVHDKDLSWIRKDHSLTKIMVIDLGITHPTVVLKIATDFKNVYVYDEYYHTNIRTGDLGEYLLEQLDTDEHFKRILIDPKSCAREQTSGTSPRKVLKDDYGIRRIELANNNVKYGIEIQKGLMTVRGASTHFFVDPVRCPNTVRELETLKWKEPEYSDFDELAYKEEPIDKDNDCTDCTRYGSVYLKKYLRGIALKERELEKRRKALWNNRISKLKIYRENPEAAKRAYDMKELRRLKELHYGKKNNRLRRVPV